MELHDYQKYAVNFIEHNAISCLLLDMGLGKTVITLTGLWQHKASAYSCAFKSSQRYMVSRD